MLCGPSAACTCAFESSSLNFSVGPAGQIIIEQAEFTDITALESAVASLQASMLTAQSDISTLQTSVAANAAAVSRLDSMAAGVVLQSGAGVGPTSGTTALVIATASPGPFGRAGTLVWGGHAIYAKTVGTDTFDVYARNDGNSRSRSGDRAQLTSGWASAATALAVTAVDDPTIDIVLVRASGTGTATTVASTNGGGLWWIFIPT